MPPDPRSLIEHSTDDREPHIVHTPEDAVSRDHFEVHLQLFALFGQRDNPTVQLKLDGFTDEEIKIM